MRRLSAQPIRLLGVVLLAIVAGVHFQQYVDFISRVPTIGVLFLLNAGGGAALAVSLLSGDRTLRVLAGLGGLGLALGSLVSIAIALDASLFGYAEPTLRLPIVIAIVAELAALPALALIVARELRNGAPVLSVA